ncbi:hypothetical protein [Aerolutibacter ruishenii]|uniref:AsmA-like protein n=1 Tax=Aerolutibacter ruishenii TaxID=686800 RepID=A0A562LSR0_9GAMM|nr:hypothetical protein [Lysobacter ruishenii]TWI10670.1 hypothetical protein IP93_01760 [Lysobacter ruishenii]
MTTRRRLVLLAALAVALAGVAALLYWSSRPPQFASLVTGTLGRSLGLEITVGGASEYRLRGTPLLVVRDVVVREPGAATPLLRADRVHVAVPWSTIRNRGQALAIRRIELDSPHLDLPALQHWLDTRPPGEEQIPTLSDGLQVNNGHVTSSDWSIDGIDATLPSLHPGQPVRARLRGRYVDEPLTIPFDLDVALSRPARQADFSARGDVTLDHGDWSMPSSIAVSGPLDLGHDAIRVMPARIGIATRYVSGDQRIPFVLGLHGPLLFDEATWTLSPASVALRDRALAKAAEQTSSVVPSLRARGRLALGKRLALNLGGTIAQWPAGWPALPPPIGQSTSPLPFGLAYEGRTDLADITALNLRRDATRFAARFRVPQVLEWSSAASSGNPLPPLDGTLSTPRLDIAGAQLEGVEVEFEGDEPASNPTAPAMQGTAGPSTRNSPPGATP